MASLRETVEQIREVAAQSDLRPSVVALDARTQPSTEMGRTFCVVVDADNSREQRDRTQIGMRRILSVRFVLPYRLDQVETQLEAEEVAESVIAALMLQPRMPSLRARWVRTRSTQLPGGEYLLTSVDFTVDHELAISSTE